MRVGLIGGGQNCEHDVSVASAASAALALTERHDVLLLTIGPDGVWASPAGSLGANPASSLSLAIALLAGCDVVLPLVHGPRGEDGTLAALLDLAGIPRAGSGLRAGALAMDKATTKLIASSLGIRVASGVVAGLDDPVSFTGPVVVKPVAAGSSYGVSLVEEASQLAPALEAARALDDRVLVEEFVTGREIDIAVLRRADGTRLVGPPLEIVLDGGVFDTVGKYGGGADFRVPASVSPSEVSALERAATALYEALGCEGVARFDFFLTADGLVLNEVNTTPGLTEKSQVPRMFAAIGLTYADLLDEVLTGAVLTAAGDHATPPLLGVAPQLSV